MSDGILTPVIVAMLAEVQQVLVKHNIGYYLVGAVARDIHLKDFPAKRKTNDVDIAIMLDSEDEFYVIKDALIDTGKFQPHATEAIKLFYENAVELDLLPFGNIENEFAETSLSKPELFVMDVPGFRELMQYAERKIIDGLQLNVCPLEGIVILKLLAYNDRPERTKDLADIEYFIKVYFDLNSEEIYNDYYDVLVIYANANNEDFEELVSQRVIGRKISKLLEGSKELLHKLQYAMHTGSPVDIRWQAMYDGMDDSPPNES